MATKAEVTILGNRYKLTSEDNQPGTIEKLAELLNERLERTAGRCRRFNPLNVSILTALELEEELVKMTAEAQKAYGRMKQQHQDIVEGLKKSYEEKLMSQKADADALRLKQHQKYQEEIQELKQAQTLALSGLKTRYEDTISSIKAEQEEAESHFQSQQNEAISKMKSDYQQDIDALKIQHEDEIFSLQSENDRLTREKLAVENELGAEKDRLAQEKADAINELQQKLDKLQKDYDELMELLDDA